MTELIKAIGMLIFVPALIFICALSFDFALKIADKIIPPKY